MLTLQRSKTTQANRSFEKIARGTRGNAAYIAQHGSHGAKTTDVVLLGGTGPVDFRVRIAQAHARDDLSPSAWSHVALLGPSSKSPGARVVYEIPLSGQTSLDYPPVTNGLVQTQLSAYDDPKLYPNVAVFSVPVPFDRVEPMIDKFSRQRTIMDALELKLAWWAFTWGVGNTGNPLFSSLGVPSAAFVEYVLAACDYDLVPGFPSRSSCPEAIWQATRWWYDFPRATPLDATDQADTLPRVAGAFDAEHYLLTPPPRDEPRTLPARVKATRAKKTPAKPARRSAKSRSAKKR